MASQAMGPTIWFWMGDAGGAAASLIWDNRVMRTLVTMAFVFMVTLGA